MNLERMKLGLAFLSDLEAAKDAFRKIRDDIPEELNGEVSASNVNLILEKVKSAYIDLYFAEHQKKRLGVNDAKRKGEIISSAKLANLKKLKTVEILSSAKLEAIESNLTSLIVCYDLTAEDLKASPICKNASCRFSLDSNEVSIKGKLDEIEDRADSLLNEWTTTLLNTISDPLVLAQESFLSKEQQNAIKSFVSDNKLPDKIDQFFINAVQALLKGFEPVSISASDFIDKLDAIGPCDVNTFKTKLNEIVTSYIAGKDNEKLRIVVKR